MQNNHVKRCPNCQTEVAENYRFCPKCRCKLDAVESTPNAPTAPSMPSSTTSQSNITVTGNRAIWRIEKGEIARHIRENEFKNLSGVSGLIINEGVSAIVYVDGKKEAELSGGCYELISDKELEQKLDTRIVNYRSLYGCAKMFVNKLSQVIYGKKLKDTLKDMGEGNYQTKDEVIDAMTHANVVSVYMKSDTAFPLIFGTSMGQDHAEFAPIAVRCKNLDADFGLSMLVRIDNFDLFIKNYFKNNTSVTTLDIQNQLYPLIAAILKDELKTEEIDEFGISSEARSRILLRLNALNAMMNGISIVSIGDITCSSKEFERFRHLSKELYCNEKELDFLKRTNDFKNRLASVENENKVQEAKNDLALKVALDEVNQDNLLHDDEEEQFYVLLSRQKRIRNAQNEMELQKALNEIRSTQLVNADEMKTLEESLALKQFERGNIDQAMRQQSLALLAKKNLELQTEVMKFRINEEDALADSQHRSDLNTIRRESETHDAMEVVYGKQFAARKARLLEEIELASLAKNAQNRQDLEAAKQKNQLLLAELENRVQIDDYELSRKRKEAAFEDERNQASLNLENQKERSRMDVLKEKQAMALSALERLRAMDEDEKESDHRREIEKEKLHLEERQTSEALRHEETMSRLANEKDYSAEKLFVSKLDPNSKASEIYASNYSSQKELEAERRASERIEAERQRMAEYRREQEEKRDREHRERELDMKENMDRLTAFAEKAMTLNAANANAQAAANAEREARNFDRIERIATHRMDEQYTREQQRVDDVRLQKEEYRDQLKQEQTRHDAHQDKALDYTTRLSVADGRGASRPSESPSKESTYVIQDLGGASFGFAQVKALIQSGTIHKQTVLSVGSSSTCFAGDVRELKEVFDGCDFAVCPHCKQKVEKSKFCTNCGEEL